MCCSNVLDVTMVSHIMYRLCSSFFYFWIGFANACTTCWNILLEHPKLFEILMQGLTSIGKHNILVEWLLFRLGCCNWLTTIGKPCTTVSCLVLESCNRTVSVAIVIVWRAACSADGVKKFLFVYFVYKIV